MITTDSFDLVGVIHLLPLPGGPGPGPGLQVVYERALRDARTLVEGGIQAAIIENLGDAPFLKEDVPPHVIASLAVLGERIRHELGDALSLGVNVLRNDVRGALGCAVACGARFVRANVLVGASWTDQGLIEGRAHEVLRYRRSLDADPREGGAGSGVLLAADVFVKHGSPAGTRSLAQVARDTAGRGGADIIIVTGEGTGQSCEPELLDEVRAAVVDVPVWVGSGVTAATLPRWRSIAQGAIVGTWLHEGGQLRAPLDPTRVRRLVAACEPT